ncbi:MAG: ABC transporter ATP-binding protein [Candidatus Glassbacteria bacterium]
MIKNFDSRAPELKNPFSIRRSLSFVTSLLRRYPSSLAAVLVLSVAAALSEMMSIALLFPFVESIRGGASSSSGAAAHLPIGFLNPIFERFSLIEKIRLIALGLLVVESVKGAARFLSGRYSSLLQIRVDSELRMRVFDQNLRAGLGYIHKERIANLFTILNNYTGNTSQTALLMTTAVPDVFLALISISILMTTSMPMTVIALVLSAFTFTLVGRLTNKAKDLGSECNRTAVEINHIGFEILSGMSLIRMFAREKGAHNRFKNAVKESQKAKYLKGLLEAAISPAASLMLAAIVVVLLIASTYIFKMESEFWISTLIIFLIVYSRLGGPLGRLNLLFSQIASSTPSVQAIIEFLEERDKKSLPEGERVFKELQEGIRFENVVFGYDTEENEVLSGVSLFIPKGKMTAVVGVSGSGKSTLVALLARLYDPDSGRITIDGVDLREFRSQTWRSRIGVVSQSTFLFNDTVRANLCFGKPEASEEQIREAAIQANAHEFIEKMKDGYQTLLGDRGIRLSGGQAQRVAIARAILVEPELLLLDEATSALDTASEKLVREAIDRVSCGRTVVVVAHRLSTIRDADNIIVLEQGRVMEQGRHEELIRQQGRYCRYVKLQDLGVRGPEGKAEAADIYLGNIVEEA